MRVLVINDDVMGLLYDALVADDEEAKAEVLAMFNEEVVEWTKDLD